MSSPVYIDPSQWHVEPVGRDMVSFMSYVDLERSKRYIFDLNPAKYPNFASNISVLTQTALPFKAGSAALTI